MGARVIVSEERHRSAWPRSRVHTAPPELSGEHEVAVDAIFVGMSKIVPEVRSAMPASCAARPVEPAGKFNALEPSVEYSLALVSIEYPRHERAAKGPSRNAQTISAQGKCAACPHIQLGFVAYGSVLNGHLFPRGERMASASSFLDLYRDHRPAMQSTQ